jgi:glucose-1-phosphate thymidylyltransferase
MTRSTSKQLLPVYDKPMIYYPISTLMLAGIREILIITTPNDQPQFKALLGDGSDFGVSFVFATQPEPRGLAQAFTIGEEFLSGDTCLMILGDNIFHGVGLGNELERLIPKKGCHIFTYRVANPSDYGILTLNKDGTPQSIDEKPLHTNSDLAVTGLYFFDSRVSKFASKVVPSARGELEITSLIQSYLELKELTFTQLTRGTAWLDTGRPASLHDASSFVRVIEERTGLKIACLEEIALNKGWITKLDVIKSADKVSRTEYGSYLYSIST